MTDWKPFLILARMGDQVTDKHSGIDRLESLSPSGLTHGGPAYRLTQGLAD
jgi:hypothetical protein